MNKEKQIENMARAVHMNCHKGLLSSEATMIAKWCYQEIDRKVSKIFEEIESIISAHYNDEISIEEMYDKIYELKKKHTEEVK